jgi:hypothetical protein
MIPRQHWIWRQFSVGLARGPNSDEANNDGSNRQSRKPCDYSKELQFLVIPDEYRINAIARELTVDNLISSGITTIAEEKLN